MQQKAKLTPQAKVFYNEWVLKQSSACYNITVDQVLYGNLSANKLRAALIRYISDHAILNSRIAIENGHPYWAENSKIHELVYFSDSLPDKELTKFVVKPFNLHEGPLYRFLLSKIDEKKYRFILVFHHLLVDGLSMKDGIFDKISYYYNDDTYHFDINLEQQKYKLISLEKSLSQYLFEHEEKFRDFWNQSLKHVENIDLKFLMNGDCNSQHTHRQLSDIVNEINFKFNRETVESLKKIKSQHQITPFVFGISIFAALLYKYTGQQNFAVSYPVAVRSGADFIYGAQTNLNLIPFRINTHTTIMDLIDHTKNFMSIVLKSDIKYSEFPIADILKQVGDNKQFLNLCYSQTNFRYTPFNFEGIEHTECISSLNVDAVKQDMIVLEQEQINDDLNFRLRYRITSFNENLLNGFLSNYKFHFEKMLTELATLKTSDAIEKWDLIHTEHCQAILNNLSRDEFHPSVQANAHELFEDQVSKNRNKIAIVYQNKLLTYDELNIKSNQIANFLIKNYPLKKDDLVALFFDKSETQVIAMLGVMKSGAAYIPMDINNPAQYIKYILKDSKPKLILTSANQHELLVKILKEINEKDRKSNISTIVSIDSALTQKTLSSQLKNNPNVCSDKTSLCYVIYTSGTTGAPKGIMVENHSLNQLLNSEICKNIVENNLTGTLFSSYGFDVSVFEIFSILTRGGTLHILPDDLRNNINQFVSYLIHNKITSVYLPPAFVPKISELLISSNLYLKNILIGVEPIACKFMKNFIEKGVKVINAYGPTETTICSTFYEVTESCDYGYLPIGRKLNNEKLYVLDKRLKPTPIGSIGELYISGAGVSRGYLNNLELTKKHFIPNFFASKQDIHHGYTRLYKTGDFVRILPDGNLKFIRRGDSQVKLRGYRIELAAIESFLNQHPKILQSKVIPDGELEKLDKNTCLIAYYVSNRKIDLAQLKYYLSQNLPNYMVPSYFLRIDSIPMTLNGKLDKSKLPLPKRKTRNNKDRNHPITIQEHIICDAFSEVLNLDNIEISDDFFDLGGNSISAIKLTSILQSSFKIKVSSIFELRTPKNIAANIVADNNSFKKILLQIKEIYKKNKHNLNIQENYLDFYEKFNKEIKIDPDQKKPISNVFLTGSTGFLGCNILHQLLEKTGYTISILIRANSQQEAEKKIIKIFKKYFGKNINKEIGKRIFVYVGDIEKRQLGLTDEEYKLLTTDIDSIIHAAALTKHYGGYEKFYSANVQSTINLLELCNLTELKDFHYISTISVLDIGDDKKYCTEYDEIPNGNRCNHVYVKTKLLGEHEVAKYAQRGVNGYIHRVGNLAFMMKNGVVQNNIESNAFYHWVKYLLHLRCIAKEISLIEISPADKVACALVTLFDKSDVKNGIFHIFNPYYFNISIALEEIFPLNFSAISINEFIDKILLDLGSKSDKTSLVRFLLRQGWLDELNQVGAHQRLMLQPKTQYILESLNFSWESITKSVFQQYLENTKLNNCP